MINNRHDLGHFMRPSTDEGGDGIPLEYEGKAFFTTARISEGVAQFVIGNDDLPRVPVNDLGYIRSEMILSDADFSIGAVDRSSRFPENHSGV